MASSTLSNDARCYDCTIPPGRQLSVIIYQLAQLILDRNREADVTPNALLNAARCYECTIPPGNMLSTTVYLLDRLVERTDGPGDPVDWRMGPRAPDLPGGDGIIFYRQYNNVTNQITNEWWWDPVTNSWYIYNTAVPLGVYWKDTIADLQMVPTENTHLRAITSGWLVAGDGGGRFYYWDASSTDSQLDGSGNQRLDVVKPDDIADADPGRWIEWTS